MFLDKRKVIFRKCKLQFPPNSSLLISLSPSIHPPSVYLVIQSLCKVYLSISLQSTTQISLMFFLRIFHYELLSVPRAGFYYHDLEAIYYKLQFQDEYSETQKFSGESPTVVELMADQNMDQSQGPSSIPSLITKCESLSHCKVINKGHSQCLVAMGLQTMGHTMMVLHRQLFHALSQSCLHWFPPFFSPDLL